MSATSAADKCARCELAGLCLGLVKRRCRDRLCTLSPRSTTFPEEEEEGWVGAQEIAKLCASFSTQSLSESNSTFTKRPR
eukprot:232838-Pleurochrysis_carterae.AAC.4